jgi:hypothetical protein
MTTGFDQQPKTFGPILRTAPRPQTLGAKLPSPPTTAAPPREPKSFDRKSA